MVPAGAGLRLKVRSAVLVIQTVLGPVMAPPAGTSSVDICKAEAVLCPQPFSAFTLIAALVAEAVTVITLESAPAVATHPAGKVHT